jgi:IclR family acetate operon transcriptional repressor
MSEKITAGEKYSVPNLERALHILEIIADRPDGMTMSEAATALKIPRNSAFRILTTLHAHQYVLRDEASGRFRLSGKLLGLGCRGTGSDRLLQNSQDVLPQLRDATGETALLGRLIDDAGVVLQQSPSKHAVKVQVEIGVRYPLHTAAPAKAIMAWMSDANREAILSGLRFQKFTSKTITSRKAFVASLAECREVGYATDIGEEVEGITCIAAPVFDFQSAPVAAVWITGPDMRLPTKQVPALGTIVANHAFELSGRLGYSSTESK